MAPSYVVTGGGRGVGRAITERLSSEGTVVVDRARSRVPSEWTESVDRVHAVVGSAADVDVARAAARLAEDHGTAHRLGEQRRGLPRRGPPRRPRGGARPGPDEPRTSRGGLLRRGLGVRGGGTTGVDRERLVAPGTASRARCTPLCHGQGRHRGTDPRGRRRPRVRRACAATPSRWARSPPSATRTSWSADPARAAEVEAQVARLHPVGRVGEPARGCGRSSRSCSPRGPASSTVRCSRSTAGVRRTVRTRRNADPPAISCTPPTRSTGRAGRARSPA